MKSLRGLLALVLIFAVMVGLLLWQDYGPGSTPAPTPLPTAIYQRVFPDLEVLQINAVQLAAPGFEKTVTIARSPEDGTWIPVGVDGSVNAQAATGIARTIALLPYRQRFSIEADTDLRQYGFRPTGDFLIQFINVFGDEHVIAIGEPSSDTPTLYAMVDDQPEVFLVERAAIDYLVNLYLEPPWEP